jgi:hypothetical protein
VGEGTKLSIMSAIQSLTSKYLPPKITKVSLSSLCVFHLHALLRGTCNALLRGNKQQNDFGAVCWVGKLVEFKQITSTGNNKRVRAVPSLVEDRHDCTAWPSPCAARCVRYVKKTTAVSHL